jgi:hypothetical protein
VIGIGLGWFGLAALGYALSSDLTTARLLACLAVGVLVVGRTSVSLIRERQGRREEESRGVDPTAR